MKIGMRAARDEAGYKQSELAKMLGVSLNTYVDWEKERKPLPSEDMAIKFADATGFKLSQLRISYKVVKGS